MVCEVNPVIAKYMADKGMFDRFPYMMHKSARNDPTAGQVRGVVSDNAQTLGDVIDRVKKAEEIHEKMKCQPATDWPYPTGNKEGSPFEQWWSAEGSALIGTRCGRADALSIFQAGRASMLGDNK